MVYTLKTPYRDGTTQVAFERGGHPPVDFVARLAALAWPAASKAEGQWNGDAQSRYHGVLAPNHRWRGLVTPARRGKDIKSNSNAEVRTPAERHAARACPASAASALGMTWAQRLKRVFSIDPNAARSRFAAAAVVL